MKRSEMITIIKDYLDIVEEEENFNPTTEDQAEYILGCCETWGMIPPSTEFDMGGTTMTDNCWDKEEEEDECK